MSSDTPLDAFDESQGGDYILDLVDSDTHEDMTRLGTPASSSTSGGNKHGNSSLLSAVAAAAGSEHYLSSSTSLRTTVEDMEET